MGRTYFYSVERLGRIGVFWNLAKHVIIYERTVAPTEQFFDKQNPHLQRPLLRKVREFVELLQPVRKYPEFGAEPVSRGFVTGTEFKSRIINLDSDWGGDIGKIGWQVPLWNRRASEAKPKVYPKPQIVLEVAADAEGGGGKINVELDEPEKLVFFTRTVEGTDSNADDWPPVGEIDFPDHPVPTRPDIPAYDPANLDRTLPDAAAIEPGYDRSTFAVAPSARPVNLVAERTEEAMNAVLRNVTMARARIKQISDFAEDKQTGVGKVLDNLKSAARIGGQVEGLLDQVLAKLPKDGTLTPDVVAELKKAIDDAIAANKLGVPGGLAENVKSLSKEVEARFRDQTKLCALLNTASDATIDINWAKERCGCCVLSAMRRACPCSISTANASPTFSIN
jgi:hypothetical protein